MILKMDMYEIVTNIKKGKSIREVQRLTGINRKTITKYWKRYCDTRDELIKSNKQLSSKEMDDLVATIIGEEKYDSSKRVKLKLTEDVMAKINDILENEETKTNLLGRNHKQKLTIRQVYQCLKEDGIDIGETTVRNYICKINSKKEIYVRQQYQYGNRLEYDFGEVKIMINGERKKLYIAVLASPASGYTQAYLYDRQTQDIFLDSHVKFFEEVGGVFNCVVYDNMRNVVTKFIGRHEKILNENLLKMALYYGFEVNVTNCYSGNEKGMVEGRVKKVRNKVFAKKYQFRSIDHARDYLAKELKIMNETSEIETEKSYLNALPPRYELASIEVHNVDKYGCVRVNNNFYSVPDYIIGKNVSVKNYYDRIAIYSNNTFVCEHKKIDGANKYQLDIKHYIHTLSHKPGALRNSLALKQSDNLYDIYQQYFKSNPKEFIAIIQQNNDKTIHQIEEALLNRNVVSKDSKDEISQSILEHSQAQLNKVTQLYFAQGEYNGKH